MILWQKSNSQRKTALLLMSVTLLCFSGNTVVEESKAECVMELNSRRVLYESHGDLRLPMASTTKIVTAATVLETCENIEEKVTISHNSEGIEGSSVYLKEGEVYTVEALLYGLMLRSGNDCAVSLATYCSNSVEDFCIKMNETAQKAGALNSSFQNPHGLPSNGHYTTAYDLSAISCYAMQIPKFREIVSTRYYEPYHWQNKNKMLFRYDGGIGIKTGYTKEAGRCLVTAAEKEGMTLICTVLNCPTMYERTTKLLDDAFASYKNVKLLSYGQVFNVEKCNAESRAEFFYPLLKEEKDLLEYKIGASKSNTDKEILGQLEIRLAKRLLFSTNLYKL